ncbi:MAG: hypothetical protein CBD88_03140 [Flavobacteriales bacterium TMED228]|nr:MAG: hypothetical protein CBD88_03140 [Flavobacteriales bacterium TMED228]
MPEPYLNKLQQKEIRKKQLSPLRLQMIEHVVATGDGHSATARALNCNRSSVVQAMNDPYVQDVLQQKVGERLTRASAIASNTLIKLARQGKSEYVQLQASDSILDRTGFKPPDRSIHQVQGDVSIRINLE